MNNFLHMSLQMIIIFLKLPNLLIHLYMLIFQFFQLSLCITNILDTGIYLNVSITWFDDCAFKLLYALFCSGYLCVALEWELCELEVLEHGELLGWDDSMLFVVNKL